MITYDEIRRNEAVRTYIQRADESLAALGYTEHSFAHVTKVAENVRYILETLGFSQHEVELGMIAAYLHDIGNLVNRSEHSQSGAVMAFRILDRMDMPAEDVATIVTAIGNHDEGTGVPVNAVAAALILADKSDVRTSRVRNKNTVHDDIHDRVNYAVFSSKLEVDNENKKILLTIKIDTLVCPVMEYFEIFLERMVLCKKSAAYFGCEFELIINDTRLL